MRDTALTAVNIAWSVMQSKSWN